MADAKIFYPTAERLSFLLASIHHREIALPDFQRDFVWEPRATEELIESICQNFPAGSLLRIKNTEGFFFQPRAIAGAPPLDGHAPSYLILDGQQRLTSLYQALYGVGDHRYYVHTQVLIDDGDLEDAVFYLRRTVGEKRFGPIEKQAAALCLPLPVLIAEDEGTHDWQQGFDEWMDAVLDCRPETGDDRSQLKQQLRAVRKRWLKNIEDYEFPMVTLADQTAAEAVCTIFETLNRTGIKLSVFDLLAARFWPEDVRLRDLWDQARADHPIIEDFGIDPYYVLQAVAILTAPGAPSCKRSAVLKMTADRLRRGWEPTIQGLAGALHILREDCGVVLPQWLPYNTIVVPAAATLATTVETTGPEVGAIREKFRRWFWCSVFGQAYESSPNSQSATDFTQLTGWFTGGEPPVTVQEFTFDVSSLRHTTTRQRAVYRGVIALILRNGSRDFHTCAPMTASMIQEKRIDDHHVFPQKYLKEAPEDVTGTLRDCVLNKTLIDRETNIRIGKRAPSDYLNEVAGLIGDDALRGLLKSHLVPPEPDSPLMRDSFEGFLDARERLIGGKIEEVTG
jgi:hypothetical protein